MNYVYGTGTGKPGRIPKIEPEAAFFSPTGLGRSSSPQQAPSTPSLQQGTDAVEYLRFTQSSVVLTIYTAEVDVDISQKLSAELHRSTRKNPPHTLKYELIYVCNPTAAITQEINIPSRQGRRILMRARRRTTLSQRQPVAFFKACAQT